MNRFFTSKIFFLFSGLFIFYATTIPWDMSHAPTLDKVAWIPLWDTKRGRLWSIPDMVQNVVLFVPYGFFGFLGLDFVRKRGPIVGALLMGGFGLALSFFVECLQTMSETRSPSATDLVTNFSGGLAGGVAAAVYVYLFKERIDRALKEILHTQPGFLIFLLYTMAVVVGSLAPFIPTLDIGLLRANVRQFLDNPWGPKPVGALLTDGLLFGAVAFLMARELPAFLGRRRWFPWFKTQPIPAAPAGLFAIVLTSGLALGLEAAQMIIIGHSPGVQDAVVGILCAAIGGGGAALMHRRGIYPASELGELSRSIPWLVLGFAVLAPTLRALQPFQIQSLSEAMQEIDVWSFVPFWALFRNINLSTFRNVFEVAAIYLPLGYALFALGRSPRVGFIVCLALAELLEVLQIPVRDRVFDITEGIYAGLMGLFGAHAVTRMLGYYGENDVTQPMVAVQRPPPAQGIREAR